MDWTQYDWYVPPKVDLKIDPVDLAWVAGLLEGEGYIHVGKITKKKYAKSFGVICTMTDHDVILKLKRVIGFGVINGPYYHKGKPLYKPYYRYSLTLKHEFYALLVAIFPHMGERRQVKILQAMESFCTYLPYMMQKPDHGVTAYGKGCRCDICRYEHSRVWKKSQERKKNAVS